MPKKKEDSDFSRIKIEETAINLDCVKTEFNEEEDNLIDYVNKNVIEESTIETQAEINEEEVNSIISTDTEKFDKPKKRRKNNKWHPVKCRYKKLRLARLNISVNIEEPTINLDCIKTELNEEEDNLIDYVNSNVIEDSTIETQAEINEEVNSIISTDTKKFHKPKKRRKNKKWGWVKCRYKKLRLARLNISDKIEQMTNNLDCIQTELNEENNLIDFINNDVKIEETTINLDCVKRELNEEEHNLIDLINSDVTVENTISSKAEIEEFESIISTEIQKFYCNKCGKSYEGYCPKCSTLTHILNKIVPFPNSTSTLKAQSSITRLKVLEIRNVGRRKGIFALKTIPRNVTFGPFNGLLSIDGVHGFTWKIKNKKFANIKEGNWMKYVDSAVDISSKNLSILRIENNLYFRTDREIDKDEELLIYYNEANMQKLNDGEFTFIPLEEEKFGQIFACTLCCLGFGLETCLIEHKSKCPYAEPHSNFKDLEIIGCQCCKIWLEKQEHLQYHVAYCWDNYRRLSSSSTNFELTEEVTKTHATDGLPTLNENHSCSNNEVSSIPVINLNNNVTNLSNSEVHQNVIIVPPVRDNIDAIDPLSNRNHTSDATSISDYDIVDSLNGDICGNDETPIVLDKVTTLNTEFHETEGVIIGADNTTSCFFSKETWESKLTPILNGTYINRSSNVISSLPKTLKYKCTECYFETNRKEVLLLHTGVHTRFSRQYKCDFCTEEFTSILERANHSKSEHAINIGGKRYYKCPQCPFKTLYGKYLKQHEYTHSDIKPLKCDFCTKTFIQKYLLKLHIKTKHSENKEKDYKCTNCNYQTNYKQAFQLHALIHSDTKTYTCRTCSSVFNQKYDLVEHRKTVHWNSSKNLHRCQECPYQTNYKGNLASHMSTHSNVKAFRCDLCKKEFRLKPTWKHHMKIKHLVGQEANKEGYKCAHCPYHTHSKITLRQHLQRHTRPYQCEICEKTFALKLMLKLHMTNQHVKDNEKTSQCE